MSLTSTKYATPPSFVAFSLWKLSMTFERAADPVYPKISGPNSVLFGEHCYRSEGYHSFPFSIIWKLSCFQ